MTVTLRSYQDECIHAIEREHGEKGLRSTLIVLATGLGKTTIFAEWVRRRLEKHGGRVLVIAHREELVQQAADRMRLQVPGVGVGIEMAGRVTSTLMPEPIVVASVQTLGQIKRLRKFDPWQFTGLVIDEAHHSCAAGYRAIVDHFASAQVLGVTATPDRLDGIGLGGIFDSCAYRMEMQAGIAGGFLVPIVAKRIVCESLDLSRLRTVRGDLSEKDLQQAMSVDKVLHEMAGPLVREAGDRSTIVFTPGVQVAHALVDVLAAYTTARACAIDGTTDSTVRREVLAAYNAGDIQFLINCAVLTEGFDSPRTSCIALGRPTKSRALMTQCIGRGTRPAPGKTDLLVVDFAGIVGRHVLVAPLDVLGGDELPPLVRARALELVDQGESLDRARAQAEREATEAERARKARERLAEEEAARRKAARVSSEARYAARQVDPFGTALLGLPPDRGGERASERQREILAQFGVEIRDLSAEQAQAAIGSQIVRRKRGLASFKQARLLQKYGYSPDLSKSDASIVISAIVEAGWARPAKDPLEGRGGAKPLDASRLPGV